MYIVFVGHLPSQDFWPIIITPNSQVFEMICCTVVSSKAVDIDSGVEGSTASPWYAGPDKISTPYPAINYQRF